MIIFKWKDLRVTRFRFAIGYSFEILLNFPGHNKEVGCKNMEALMLSS